MLSVNLPTDLQYQSGSPYFSQGFLNNLTTEQQDCVNQLFQWADESRVDLSDLAYFSTHIALVLLRYLRANNFKLEKTKKHILDNIKWRNEMNVRDIVMKSPENILKVDTMSELTVMFPHWHCGFDMFGRPVLYKQYGLFEATTLLKKTSLDAIMKYHLWEQEACMELCCHQTNKTGFIVETITAVIDIEGMQLRQVTTDFLNIVKGIAKIDQAQYPETLGRFFIINAPALFPVVWRGVKPFLDPVVVSKIHIFSKENEWKPKLVEYIGAENLPEVIINFDDIGVFIFIFKSCTIIFNYAIPVNVKFL